MHQGLKDLMTSERGTICVLLIVVSSVFVLAGKLPVDTWIAFAKWIATVLVASKTITGAVETWNGSNAPPVGQSPNAP